MSVKSHPARDAAIAAGQKTYVTGVKCQNGHLSPRLVANGNCKECDLGGQWMRRTGKTRKEFEKMRAAKRRRDKIKTEEHKKPAPTRRASVAS